VSPEEASGVNCVAKSKQNAGKRRNLSKNYRKRKECTGPERNVNVVWGEQRKWNTALERPLKGTTVGEKGEKIIGGGRAGPLDSKAGYPQTNGRGGGDDL